jgi:type IV pilus assembly protein PilN
MIQINLLGLPKPKKGKRAAAASIPGEGPNPAILILIALLVSGAILGVWYYKLQGDRAAIEKKMATAQKEAQELAVAKSKYEEEQAQEKNFEQRKQVIEDLLAKKTGPVELLTKVGDTVNNTEGVWLSTMIDDGHNVNLEGAALSVHQVATLMKNLQGTGYFRSVELKETSQDAQVKDMQQFNFSLVCEKLDKSTPAPAGGAAGGAGATAPKKM